VRRTAPRPLANAVEAAVADLAPKTPLARVQAVWTDAVGERNAAQGTPVRLAAGRLTVYCEHAGWAEELQLLGLMIARRLNERLGGEVVREIRCTGRRPRGL
jgi:predicted nucleic acid-binding Zn ribbon protein